MEIREYMATPAHDAKMETALKRSPIIPYMTRNKTRPLIMLKGVAAMVCAR
jgi:hypothetical protein